MPRFFDKQGDPIEWDQHVRLSSDPNYRVIGSDTLLDRKLVSTIWLGIGLPGPITNPFMFETMVFTPDFEQIDSHRYLTLEEAKLGHQKMIEKWEICSGCQGSGFLLNSYGVACGPCPNGCTTGYLVGNDAQV